MRCRRAARRPASWCAPSPTTAPASPRACGPACSSRSSRGGSAGPGWGSRSCSAPWMRTAAWSWWIPPRDAGPRSRCTCRQPVGERKPRDMTAQPSILVVDDEMGILDVLRILLKGEGFEVTTAQGGKAGLEALKAGAPDIVLTDIKMPGVSGTELLAAVREQDPETPVILMTAQASLQSAIQAVNQGAFYYIQKPFSNDDLVTICRRAVEYRELRSENKHLKREIRRRDRSRSVKPLGKSRRFIDVLKLAE